MYLIGAPHRHKTDAQRLLEKLLSERIRLDAIQPAFETLLGVIDEVLQVDLATVERAKEVLLGSRRLSARDCLHLAVMERHGIDTILTFDSGFDGFPGIKRLAS
jgi:hypothetical protein